MPRFAYVALTDRGTETRGTLDANDIGEARQTLRTRALRPLELNLEDRESALLSAIGEMLRHPARLLPVRNRDKQFLFRQLALMIRSGHRLRNALEIASAMVGRERLRQALLRMIGRIDGGDSFAASLRAEGRLFPRQVPALVAAGERSGTLDRILAEIAVSMERAQELRNTVLRALVMPAITLLVAFGVLGFVVFWLVPILSDFLARNGSDIHWTMQILVSIAEFGTDRGKLMATLSGATVFALLVAYSFPPGRLALDRALLSVPLFGRSIVLFEMARFGSLGVLLVRAGLRQVETLRVLADVTQNHAMRAAYLRAAEGLLDGQTMAEALDTPVVDPLARRMVHVGETSGGLDEVLDNIGRYYADEVETRIRLLIGSLVPAITILVGVVVGVIYLSVILTVLGAYTSVR